MGKFQKTTSESLYNSLVEKKFEPPFQEKVWQRLLGIDETDFANVYMNKIKLADKKLAEFNFEVLHLILPCGVNLKRWGIRYNKECNICKLTHDIPHMLFHCKKAQVVWKMVSKLCNGVVSLKDVILTDMNPNISVLITIIAFSLYKEWLLYGESENWHNHDIVSYVKLELSFRIKIYENLNSITDVVNILKDAYRSLIN